MVNGMISESMKHVIITALIIICMVLGCKSRPKTSPQVKAEATQEDINTRIENFISQLGDVDETVREKARRELEHIGEPAYGQLRTAVIQSDNPEIKRPGMSILKVILSKKLGLSGRILKKMPDIYDNLIMADYAGKYAILQKVVAFGNEAEGGTQTRVANQDVASLIREVVLDEGERLTYEQKHFIICLSVGRDTSASESDMIIILWDRTIPQAAPYIKEFLNDPDTRIRLESARALIELGSKDGVPVLLELLRHNNFDIRESAADVIVKSNVREAVPEVISLLKNKDNGIRRTAVTILTKINARESAPEMAKLLNDGDNYIRRMAVAALVELNARYYVPDLTALLKDEDSAIRMMVLSALGRFDDRSIIPEVTKLLKDINSSVAGWAAIVLVELGAKDRLAPKSVNDIREVLNQNDINSRMRAAAALKALGQPGEEKKR